jgi:excisionase family DNA binding protein
VTKRPDVDKLLYTPVEAAHGLGVSRSTIYVLLASGELPSVRIGALRRIAAEAALRRYVEQLTSAKDGGVARTAPARASNQTAPWE